MPDGVRLAARLWLPRGAAEHPVPAILEYIPYRKGDMARARDERNHPVFAAAGYACLRVDMRGSGDSEGLMPDMYAPQELEDARRVIVWIAEQRWCDGNVGMFGTSWGGTASLQAAIDAPAALKAVIAVCATHDRYEDDIHHKGGLLLTDSIEWGATLPTILASPPSAAHLGEAWFALWQNRLQEAAFPLETWIREEERSPYWQWGSVADQAGRIACPVLAIGGWSDRYSNSVMSLVELNEEKVWGIVGPWGHQFPDAGHPGPAIGFQQEALDWWDFWLKPNQGRSISWPKLRIWLAAFDPPEAILDRRRGHWIELPGRAGQETEPLVLYPKGRGLTEGSGLSDAKATIPYDLRVGAAGGDSGYFGRHGGLPSDQAIDDQRSLVFETEPLAEAVTLLGSAEAILEVASDRPLAQLALRLSDVSPEGAVARVGLTLCNLALSDSLESGRPMTPGRRRQVQVTFPTKVQRFAAGHRIRLALSCSYWPLAWPAPKATRITLRLQGCRLTLPCLVGRAKRLSKPFPNPQTPTAHFRQIEAGKLTRSSYDEKELLTSAWHQGLTSQWFPATETLFGYETKARRSVRPDAPLSAVSRFEHRMLFERPDGTAEVTGWTEVQSDLQSFKLSGGLQAEWQGHRLFERTWSPKIPRRLS